MGHKQVETKAGEGGGEREEKGMHLSSLRTDTPRKGKMHKVKPLRMKRGQTKKVH